MDGLFVTVIFFVVVFLNHDHTFVNVTFQCCCNGWGERRFLRCKERGCCWHLQVLQWHPTFTCIFCMSSSNLLVFFHGVKFLSFGFFCIWVVISLINSAMIFFPQIWTIVRLALDIVVYFILFYMTEFSPTAQILWNGNLTFFGTFHAYMIKRVSTN